MTSFANLLFGTLLGAAALLHPASQPLSVPTPHWVEQAGIGVTAPACGSSNIVPTPPTCNNGAPVVNFTWTNAGSSPGLEDCQTVWIRASVAGTGSFFMVADGLACSGNYTWNGASLNTTYDYEIRYSTANYAGFTHVYPSYNSFTTETDYGHLISGGQVVTPDCPPSSTPPATPPGTPPSTPPGTPPGTPPATPPGTPPPGPSDDPVAQASISANGGSFAHLITVTQGQPTPLRLSATGSSDPQGWNNPVGGISSGGTCEWNSNLDQLTSDPWGSRVDRVVLNPNAPEDCEISLGSLTFNDAPGIYTYEVLRIVDNQGHISNLGTVQVSVKDRPDLVVSQAPVLNSGSLIAGNTVSFKGEIKNQGGVTAQGTFKNHFLIDINADNLTSNDADLSPDISLSDLGPDSKQTVTSGSWTATAGTHRVVLCTDQPNPSIIEKDENNNCDSAVITVLPLKADLVVVDNPIIDSGNPSRGNILTFRAIIKNQGASATGRFANRFEIDVNNDGGQPIILTPPDVQNLNSLEQQTVVTPGWTAESGTHKLTVCANKPLTVDEADSSSQSNCRSTIFTVGGVPSTIEIRPK